MHKAEPMPVPALYVYEFTKLEQYSGMDLLTKWHSNTSTQGILHEIVKLNKIITYNVYLMTLTAVLQKWNYFFSTKVHLAVIGLYSNLSRISFSNK